MTTTENTLRAPAAVAGLSCSAPQRNFGLDAIRAAAISLVVVAHYATIAPVCGVVGVELFFVLSGFLIGGILYRLVLNRNELSVHDLLS